MDVALALTAWLRAYSVLCIGLPLYALLLWALLWGPDGEDANADPPPEGDLRQ